MAIRTFASQKSSRPLSSKGDMWASLASDFDEIGKKYSASNGNASGPPHTGDSHLKKPSKYNLGTGSAESPYLLTLSKKNDTALEDSSNNSVHSLNRSSNDTSVNAATDATDVSHNSMNPYDRISTVRTNREHNANGATSNDNRLQNIFSRFPQPSWTLSSPNSGARQSLRTASMRPTVSTTEFTGGIRTPSAFSETPEYLPSDLKLEKKTTHTVAPTITSRLTSATSLNPPSQSTDDSNATGYLNGTGDVAVLKHSKNSLKHGSEFDMEGVPHGFTFKPIENTSTFKRSNIKNESPEVKQKPKTNEIEVQNSANITPAPKDIEAKVESGKVTDAINTITKDTENRIMESVTNAHIDACKLRSANNAFLLELETAQDAIRIRDDTIASLHKHIERLKASTGSDIRKNHEADEDNSKYVSTLQINVELRQKLNEKSALLQIAQNRVAELESQLEALIGMEADFSDYDDQIDAFPIHKSPVAKLASFTSHETRDWKNEEFDEAVRRAAISPRTNLVQKDYNVSDSSYEPYDKDLSFDVLSKVLASSNEETLRHNIHGIEDATRHMISLNERNSNKCNFNKHSSLHTDDYDDVPLSQVLSKISASSVNEGTFKEGFFHEKDEYEDAKISKVLNKIGAEEYTDNKSLDLPKHSNLEFESRRVSKTLDEIITENEGAGRSSFQVENYDRVTPENLKKYEFTDDNMLDRPISKFDFSRESTMSETKVSPTSTLDEESRHIIEKTRAYVPESSESFSMRKVSTETLPNSYSPRYSPHLNKSSVLSSPKLDVQREVSATASRYPATHSSFTTKEFSKIENKNLSAMKESELYSPRRLYTSHNYTVQNKSDSLPDMTINNLNLHTPPYLVTRQHSSPDSDLNDARKKCMLLKQSESNCDVLKRHNLGPFSGSDHLQDFADFSETNFSYTKKKLENTSRLEALDDNLKFTSLSDQGNHLKKWIPETDEKMKKAYREDMFKPGKVSMREELLQYGVDLAKIGTDYKNERYEEKSNNNVAYLTPDFMKADHFASRGKSTIDNMNYSRDLRNDHFKNPNQVDNAPPINDLLKKYGVKLHEERDEKERKMSPLYFPKRSLEMRSQSIPSDNINVIEERSSRLYDSKNGSVPSQSIQQSSLLLIEKNHGTFNPNSNHNELEKSHNATHDSQHRSHNIDKSIDEVMHSVREESKLLSSSRDMGKDDIIKVDKSEHSSLHSRSRAEDVESFKSYNTSDQESFGNQKKFKSISKTPHLDGDNSKITPSDEFRKSNIQDIDQQMKDLGSVPLFKEFSTSQVDDLCDISETFTKLNSEERISSNSSETIARNLNKKKASQSNLRNLNSREDDFQSSLKEFDSKHASERNSSAASDDSGANHNLYRSKQKDTSFESLSKQSKSLLREPSEKVDKSNDSQYSATSDRTKLSPRGSDSESHFSYTKSDVNLGAQKHNRNSNSVKLNVANNAQSSNTDLSDNFKSSFKSNSKTSLNISSASMFDSAIPDKTSTTAFETTNLNKSAASPFETSVPNNSAASPFESSVPNKSAASLFESSIPSRSAADPFESSVSGKREDNPFESFAGNNSFANAFENNNKSNKSSVFDTAVPNNGSSFGYNYNASSQIETDPFDTNPRQGTQSVSMSAFDTNFGGAL